MRWPGVSLWGLLWLWVPLAGGRPVRLEKVRADTRNLTRTLSTRIQQLQVRPGGGREGQGGLGGCPPPSQGHPIGFTACPMSPKGGGWAVRWGALRPRVVAAGAGGGTRHDDTQHGVGGSVLQIGGGVPREGHPWLGWGTLCPKGCPGLSVGGSLHPSWGGGSPRRVSHSRGGRTPARGAGSGCHAFTPPPQLFPLSLKISGLEAIPGEGAPEGLGAMDHRLQLFQRLLGGLAAGNLPLAQIANDMENLRSLLAALATHLGCPPLRTPPGPPGPPGLSDLLVEAPHTAAGLALARLRVCLDGIAARLDGLLAC